MKKKEELIFLIAYGLYIFYNTIYILSNFNQVLSSQIFIVIRYIIYGLLVLKILLGRFSLKSMSVFIVLISLAIAIDYKSKDNKILILVLMTFASRNVEFKKIVNITLKELSFLCILVTLSSLIGIIPNYVFYREDNSIRQALGFTYVGQLPTFWLEIVFLIMYIQNEKNNKINIWGLLALSIISFTIYILTDVRNMFFITIFLIVLYYIYTHKVSFFKNVFIKNIIIYSYIICFVISISTAVSYNPNIKWQYELNNVLSNRLSLSKNMIEKYDINLLGNNINMIGVSAVMYKDIPWSEYSYIDNNYIQVLLKYGIIISIFIMMSYTNIIKRCMKEKNELIGIWFFILAISSTISDTILNIYYNCAILLLFSSLRTSKEINKMGEYKNE